MKKLLSVLLCGIMLVGCGGGQAAPKKETTKCSMNLLGMNMDINLDVVDEKIDGISYVMTLPGDLMEVDFDTLGDAEKATLEEEMMASFEESGMKDKASVSYENNNMIVTVKFDMETDKEAFEEIAGTELPSNFSDIEGFESEMEEAGFTCELVK